MNRFREACGVITGVAAQNQGVHWYELLLPVGLASAITAASGQRSQRSALYIEAFLADAQRTQPVVKAAKVLVRDLNNSDTATTAEDFSEAIDAVANDLEAFLQ